MVRPAPSMVVPDIRRAACESNSGCGERMGTFVARGGLSLEPVVEWFADALFLN